MLLYWLFRCCLTLRKHMRVLLTVTGLTCSYRKNFQPGSLKSRWEKSSSRYSVSLDSSPSHNLMTTFNTLGKWQPQVLSSQRLLLSRRIGCIYRLTLASRKHIIVFNSVAVVIRKFSSLRLQPPLVAHGLYGRLLYSQSTNKNEWMDKWLDGWMDGWTSQSINESIIKSINCFITVEFTFFSS